MVTTRRQSHGLPNEELRDGSEIDTPRKVSKKRKDEKSEANTPVLLSAKRRKTGYGRLESDEPDPSGKNIPTASEQQGPTVEVDKAVKAIDEARESEVDLIKAGARQSSSKQEQGKATKGVDDDGDGIKPSERVRPSQANKAVANRAQHNQDDHLEVGASSLTLHPDDATTATTGVSTAPKPIHFRFGSEEPELSAMHLNNGKVHVDAPSAGVGEGAGESDTEDEAPEIITASVGAETARARHIEADKAAGRQRAAAKEKRRERNDVLQQQAQSSNKAKKRKAMEIPDEESKFANGTYPAISPPKPAHGHAGTIARHPLPALLPDDILAAEPAARSSPHVDLEHGDKPKPRKHVFVETDLKPPKDIKRGPVKVRVLEGRRQNLAPKVSKESRNLKESWLAGRRGKNGATAMARRKVGLGFART